MPSTITITDAQGKKVRAKVGDNVIILRQVNVKRKKNAEVAKFPAPVIVDVERTDGRVHAWVQFHTVDKRPHRQLFVGADLQLAAPMFKIGDRVEVVEVHPTVFVPVGCQGTVVGGDGTTFHVTFTAPLLRDGTPAATPITLSQSGVEGTALKFIKSGMVQPPSESSGSDRECDSDSDSDSGSGSESESSSSSSEERESALFGDTPTEAAHAEQDQQEEEESKQCSSRHVDVLAEHMSDVVRAALMRHLRATTLLHFKDWFASKCQHAHVRVETLPELQAHLIRFTRDMQPAFRLSPAHKVALRNIGASSADLLEIEHQPSLRGGELQDFMNFFTNMKRN